MLSLLLATALGGWAHYGGDLAGTRHAADVNLSPENVADLEPAWTFRTGDARVGPEGKTSSFRATPILVDGSLVFSTGFNRVFSIDASTGKQRWVFDPEVDLSRPYSEMYKSRGVEVWRDTGVVERGQRGPSTQSPAARGTRSGRTSEQCTTRVFLGTLDARLFAIDVRTGRRCADFGKDGEVDLSKGIRGYRAGEFSVTSPPLAVGDVVVVGSSIGDNGAARLEPGLVRAYDARTGALRWSLDPTPTGAGGANVWTAMSADAERGLVFLPTSSPSPDFFGGHRPKDDGHANSLVAVRASTGEIVWSYRVVRHDLWDFDLASQPLLIDWPGAKGAMRPAVVLPTKMGFVFVLDRETGRPLVPVEERPVPKSHVPGEAASPTQRFSRIQLLETGPELPEIWDFTPAHRKKCERMLAGVRFDGIFTPPSVEGTLLNPGNSGGTNWGSATADTERQLLFMAINRLPTVVKLIPRAQFREQSKSGTLNGADAQYTSQSGTPYGMARFDLYDPSTGAPCLRGPWAQLVAMEIGSGTVRWRAPAGRYPGVPENAPEAQWGYYARGGPASTAGGLVFLATPFDTTISAHDARSGQVVWSHALPAGADATPMIFRQGEYEYVVIAAGNRLREGEGRGDHLVAFRRKIGSS